MIYTELVDYTQIRIGIQIAQKNVVETLLILEKLQIKLSGDNKNGYKK